MLVDMILVNLMYLTDKTNLRPLSQGDVGLGPEANAVIIHQTGSLKRVERGL